jgi:tetratricopeptide (TPR) repeat protein
MWGYRARDVARMLGMPVEEVRRFAREGLVPARRGPRNELRFSFEDLPVLRAASGLFQARLPAARVRRALVRLRSQLPAGRSLGAVKVGSEGTQVVASDGGARWNPETGQTLLDLDGPRRTREVTHLRAQHAQPAIQVVEQARALFASGCDLEEAFPSEALAAYRGALALDAGHAGAHLNLGRLLHEAGDPVAAEGHYRRALADAAQAPVAAFNLGVALEDQGRDEEALAAYHQALLADTGLADAHFNASRIEERAGRRADALRHLGAYRRLTRAHPG